MYFEDAGKNNSNPKRMIIIKIIIMIMVLVYQLANKAVNNSTKIAKS